MDLELIKGAFTNAELLSLLEPMVHTKIQFNESKIDMASTEEDIKRRESRIKQLQKDWQVVRQELLRQPGLLQVQAVVSW